MQRRWAARRLSTPPLALARGVAPRARGSGMMHAALSHAEPKRQGTHGQISVRAERGALRKHHASFSTIPASCLHSRTPPECTERAMQGCSSELLTLV